LCAESGLVNDGQWRTRTQANPEEMTDGQPATFSRPGAVSNNNNNTVNKQ